MRHFALALALSLSTGLAAAQTSVNGIPVTINGVDPAGAATAAQNNSAQKSANLSDLANAPTARTNLGLKSAALADTTAFDAAGVAAGLVASGQTIGANTSGTSNTTHYSDMLGDPRNIQVTAGAEYSFAATGDQAGTTLHDIATVNSASPLNGTFCSGNASNPTWTGSGLAFDTVAINTGTPSQMCVTMPFKTWRTALLYTCTFQYPPTIAPNGPAQPYPANGGTWLGSSAEPVVQIMTDRFRFAYNGFATNPQLDGFNTSGAAGITQAQDRFGSCHTQAYTLGTNASTDPDHIYIDGQEVAYTTQTASASLATSPNNYTLGASILAGTGLNTWGYPPAGTIYYAVFDTSSEWTPAQIAAKSSYIQDQLKRRAGVPSYPYFSTNRTPVLGFIGDSITAGYGGPVTTLWPLNVTTTNTYLNLDLAIAGETAHDACAMMDERIMPYVNDGIIGTWEVYIGGDDILQGYSNYQDIWQAIACVGKKLHQRGQRVIVTTGIAAPSAYASVTDGFPTNYTYPLWRTAFDGLIDMHNDPTIGCDSCASNTTYFQSDQIHPTNAGGTVLGAAVADMVAYLDGYTTAAPHVVTASTYTMVPADKAVNYQCTNSSGCTVTLPIGYHFTDQAFTIDTNASTYPVTVATQNSTSVHGSTTLAINTTTEFRPERTSTSTSSNTPGYYWRAR